MASLVVTFTSAFPTPQRQVYAPVKVGSIARTELIELDASDASVVGTLSALASEHVVTLYAEAACYVQIGTSPTAVEPDTPGANVHFLAEGTRDDFWVAEGHKVAAIAVA